jgi:hypothetical protein
MVTLQTFSQTGRLCPICGNHSVFTDDIYKFWVIYSHTVQKCEMDKLTCSYEIKTDKNGNKI